MKKCNKEKNCSMRKVKHGMSVTWIECCWKKVQHEKSAIQKWFNLKRVQSDMSAVATKNCNMKWWDYEKCAESVHEKTLT